MKDSHITKRRLIAVPERDFKEFEQIVEQIRQETGIKSLHLTQAFPLVLQKAKKELERISGT